MSPFLEISRLDNGYVVEVSPGAILRGFKFDRVCHNKDEVIGAVYDALRILEERGKGKK